MQRIVREGTRRDQASRYNRATRGSARNGDVGGGAAASERGNTPQPPQADAGPGGSASAASAAADPEPSILDEDTKASAAVPSPEPAVGEEEDERVRDVGTAQPEESLEAEETEIVKRRPWLSGTDRWWHPAASEHPYTTLGLDLLEAAAAAERGDGEEVAAQEPPEAPAAGQEGNAQTTEEEEEEEAFSEASRAYAHRRADATGPAAAYGEGLTLLLHAARAGDASAMFSLAMRALVGAAGEEGLAMDRVPASRIALPTALDLLRGAAGLGHADATAVLALLADAGWALAGVDSLHARPAPAVVLSALETAARQGSDVARYALGTRLLYGFGGAHRSCDTAVHHVMPLAEAATDAVHSGETPPQSAVREQRGGRGK